LGRMPHFTLFIIFLILIQSDKRGKWNYTIHRKIVMPEHTHTYIHFYIDRLADYPALPGYSFIPIRCLAFRNSSLLAAVVFCLQNSWIAIYWFPRMLVMYPLRGNIHLYYGEYFGKIYPIENSSEHCLKF
jgi:hypothetical protein